MVYFCTKFHIPSFNGLLVITIQPKAQQNSHTATALVTLRQFIPLCYNKISPSYYILKNIIFNKALFYQLYYHTSLEEQKLHGATAAPTSPVHESSWLLLMTESSWLLLMTVDH